MHRCRSCDGPSGRSDKTRSDVAEDQRVVILTGLVANNPRIGAARRMNWYFPTLAIPVDRPRKNR